MSNVDLNTAGFNPRSGESYAIKPRIGIEADESVFKRVSEMTSPPMLFSS